MKDSERISSLLKQVVEKKGLSQPAISKETGVHQSQISRILAGDFVLLSKNVRKLCKYAKIEIASHTPQRAVSSELQKVLDELLGEGPGSEGAVLAILKGSSRLLRSRRCQ